MLSTSYLQPLSSISDYWAFSDNSIISFNDDVTFADVPQQGVPSDNSLVGYWSMDDGVGTSVYDESSNGNNGCLYGSVNGLIYNCSVSSGKYGDGLDLPGVNSFMQLSSEVGLSGPFTLSAWVRLDSNSGYQFLFGSSYKNCKIGFSGSNLFVRITNNGNSASVILNLSNQWVNIVISRDSDNIVYFYLNNNKQKLFGGAPQSGTFYFDKLGVDESSHYLHGVIDDIQVFDRMLSDDEVSSMYNNVQLPRVF
jgi:predicted heme/steroid binding protein